MILVWHYGKSRVKPFIIVSSLSIMLVGAALLGVVREILNEHNSILVDPSSVDAWSQAIKTLTSEKSRCDLGEMAYKDFYKNYTWDIRAKNLLTELNIL